MIVSVITPTYNRATTLPRVANSLGKQGIDLEWIVVDDGSTDDTTDVMAELADQAPFPVRVVPQPHGGKHAALNRGVLLARGEMIAQIDSDDELLPGSLARLLEHWHGIPAEERDRFVGVTGRCVNEHGHSIGNRFPGDTPVDCSWQEAVYLHHKEGERSGILRTDVLRDHPFPDLRNQAHVSEGTIWRQIGKHYLTRYVDDPVRIYHTEGEDRITGRPFGTVARALLVYYSVVLREDLRWFRSAPKQFLRAAVQYTRASIHEQVPLLRQASVLPMSARALWLSTLPLGVALWLRDRMRSESHTRKPS